MIKRILRTKLTFGYIYNSKKPKIVKNLSNIIFGFKAFKVDKRPDNWIEIKDAGNFEEKWALFKRIETNWGALYLGFGFGKKPLAYFRPYKRVKDLNIVRKALKEIRKKYKFLKIDWTLRGGSEIGQFFHFRVQILNYYNFILFLSPIPSDYKKIISKLTIPKAIGIRLNADYFKIEPVAPTYFSIKTFQGSLIYRSVLTFIQDFILTSYLLKEKEKERKYAVLGFQLHTVN